MDEREVSSSPKYRKKVYSRTPSQKSREISDRRRRRNELELEDPFRAFSMHCISPIPPVDYERAPTQNRHQDGHCSSSPPKPDGRPAPSQKSPNIAGGCRRRNELGFKYYLPPDCYYSNSFQNNLVSTSSSNYEIDACKIAQRLYKSSPSKGRCVSLVSQVDDERAHQDGRRSSSPIKSDAEPTHSPNSLRPDGEAGEKETQATLKVITNEKFPAISLSDDDSDFDLLTDANEAE